MMIKEHRSAMKFMTKITSFVILIAMFLSINLFTSKSTYAFFPVCCPCTVTCVPYIQECDRAACECQSNEDTPITIQHITDQFILQREWLIKVVWEANLLPAMMMIDVKAARVPVRTSR